MRISLPFPRIILFAGWWTALTGAVLPMPAGGAAAASSAIVRGQQGARLDSVARQAETQGFHGVVLVAKAGAEALLKGYGTANAAIGARYTPSTVVPIGSCVKDFTKVAIFQLVEAGKLKLSDRLSRFFPGVPADKRAITVGQVLEHRAGFPSAVGPDEEPLTKEELLRRLFAWPLEFPPGTSESYSNAGYSLLAALVERVTGESFDGYLYRAILQPLGLRETGLLRPRFAPARLAHAYRWGEDRGTMLDLPQKVESQGWALRGNGGYLSTVRDMLRFYRAVHGPVLLRDGAHRNRVLSLQDRKALAGSDGVSYFIFANFPREGVEIVVASNHAEWQGDKLVSMLLPALGIKSRRAR
jgi:CubicO group peptidase (beta-lactamase class C family)